MMMDIKLRRKFDGQDSWGEFIEEIGVDNEGKLAYRKTTGGNCDIGEYLEWENEEKALEFMLGFVPTSSVLTSELRKEIVNLPTMMEYEIDYKSNYGWY